MVNLTYLGHSAFLIKGEKVSFVTDPYEDDSVPNLKMPRVEANYVFCSHTHKDHCAAHLVKQEPTDEVVEYEEILVPHDHHNGSHRGLNTMYIFNVDGLRILHAGDLGCIPSNEILEKMENIDVLLAPINGHYTISAMELYEIMQMVHPKVTIPIHYYRENKKSGYPDGGQIDIFKSIVKRFKEVNKSSFNLDKELLKNKVVILERYLQE